jgi:hypothetical protein
MCIAVLATLNQFLFSQFIKISLHNGYVSICTGTTLIITQHSDGPQGLGSNYWQQQLLLFSSVL